MKTKTITYQRVLNIGNYESKRLEEYAEVEEGEDPELAMSKLMERVERKLREDAAKDIEEYLTQQKLESKKLREEILRLREEINSLQQQKEQMTSTEAVLDTPVESINGENLEGF